MNQLQATLIHIETLDPLHALTFSCGEEIIKVLSLELINSLNVGDKVNLTVKSSDIALAKDISGVLSFSNQLKAKVISVNNGALLSVITVEIEGFVLESLISVEASLLLKLNNNDEVLVLIEGSHIALC